MAKQQASGFLSLFLSALQAHWSIGKPNDSQTYKTAAVHILSRKAESYAMKVKNAVSGSFAV